MKKDALGDRMKEYEAREAGTRFMPMIPIYARIDGRSFSQFTKGLKTPFDDDFRRVMVETTRFLVEQTGAKMGYTQSDEISLCWMADTYDGETFFGGRKQKMTSQLAALASVRFYRALWESENPVLRSKAHLTPTFDARVFQLPTKTECVNAFLWREQDATKNALSMAVREHYSHKQVLGKTRSEQHEMLFAKGINFNDYPASIKRGVYLARRKETRPLTEDERLKIPEGKRPIEGSLVERSRVVELSMPPLAKITNKIDVFFAAANPEQEMDPEPEQKDVLPPRSMTP